MFYGPAMLDELIANNRRWAERKVAADPWKSQAGQRVAVMESKALTVVTPGPSGRARQPI